MRNVISPVHNLRIANFYLVILLSIAISACQPDISQTSSVSTTSEETRDAQPPVLSLPPTETLIATITSAPTEDLISTTESPVSTAQNIVPTSINPSII